MSESSLEHLYSCSLFRGIEKELVIKILESSERKSYRPGEELIAKGNVPKALFIVAHGKVKIYNEDILLAQLGPLAILGESFFSGRFGLSHHSGR